VAVPWRARANGGAFSPDGRYLTVVFGGGDTGQGWVIDVAARRLLGVPGAVMVVVRSGWRSAVAGWRLAAGVGPLTEQLAVWRPGDRVLHVPRRQPRPASTRHGQVSGTAQRPLARPAVNLLREANYR